MKKISILFFWIVLLAPLTGCGRPAITLRVLDEVTKKPIAGAVAIAEWTRSEGLPGLSTSKTARVEEQVSGPDGTLTFSPVPVEVSRQIPNIMIYKPGYVGWHNFSMYKGILFNDYRRAHIIKKAGFEYKSQDVYLEHWKDGHTRYSHYRFLTNISIDDTDAFRTQDSLYEKEVRKFELPLLREEEKYHDTMQKGGK